MWNATTVLATRRDIIIITTIPPAHIITNVTGVILIMMLPGIIRIIIILCKNTPFTKYGLHR
jgi:hypothetical protein